MTDWLDSSQKSSSTNGKGRSVTGTTNGSKSRALLQHSRVRAASVHRSHYPPTMRRETPREHRHPLDHLLQEVLRHGGGLTRLAELPAHLGVRRDAPNRRVPIRVTAEVVITEMTIRVPLRNVAVRLRALLEPVLAHVPTDRLVLASDVVLAISGKSLTAAQVSAHIRKHIFHHPFEQIELLHFDQVFLPRVGRPLLDCVHVQVVANHDDVQGCDLLAPLRSRHC